MAITPHGIRIFTWFFFSAYMVVKILWYSEFTMTLPDVQQFNARSVTYHSAHVVVAVLTMATVTFRKSSLIRAACIALTAMLLFLTVFLGAFIVYGFGYPVPASVFSIHLLDSTMLVVAYMVAINFRDLVN